MSGLNSNATDGSIFNANQQASEVNLSVPSEELENRVFSEIPGGLNVELGLAH
jgi:hypothetical protein